MTRGQSILRAPTFLHFSIDQPQSASTVPRTMPHYFAVDARFSLSRDQNDSLANNHPASYDEEQYPSARSNHGKALRARSGSVSISSFSSFPTSPVDRFTQSMGPERAKPATENCWRRHTTPAMSTRRGDLYFTTSWDSTHTVQSNRKSVWRRFTQSVDKCVFRVVSKFYK